MSVKIMSVEENSPARAAGILPGETLLSINSNRIDDVLDYRFYETNRLLSLEVEDQNRSVRTVSIRKGEYESLGLDFETYLMDKQRSCRNRCIFCFIDQLPEGMRESLYFKDDDARLSFLFGNYVTLTNMSGRDVERIIKMHISPVNVSVHTTNPELRVKMMRNRFAGKSLDLLYRLAKAGVHINAQIVLCRGVNDGAELERTLTDLGALYPSVQSVAVVPVGLTRFRERLFPLEPYDRESARGALRITERLGDRFQARCGRRICYAADEFYLKAGLPIPPASFYGDFDQLENGVGLLANLKQEFLRALEEVEPQTRERRVTLITGQAAAPFLNSLLDGLRAKCHNLICRVVPIENDFFGHKINVAGLVTGQDILKQLCGKELGDELLFPAVMLRREDDVFLDDVTVSDLRDALGVRVTPVRNDGYEFVNAVLGRESDA